MEIDGRQKSGSGSIVRDGMLYAALSGVPLHLMNIRARRGQSGLRPQHVTVVKAITQVCGGQVEGAVTGSRDLKFTPGQNRAGGDFVWDIGTAGSAVMLAQTILPVALFAQKPSRHTITGGLFQDFAPTVFHFLHVLLPAIHNMGVNADLEVKRPGYVPRGGGVIVLRINPLAAPLRSLRLSEPGPIGSVTGIALSSLLEDRQVSQRMAQCCEDVLRTAGIRPEISVEYDTSEHPVFETVAVQPGAALAIWGATETGCLLGADRAGAPGRRSESIGQAVARQFLEDLRTGATVDRFQADQVIPYCALANGWSQFIVPKMTEHVQTRLWLAEKMLGAKIQVRGTHIRIEGIGKLGSDEIGDRE